eukprot:jgi/Chlat1/9291/Chrsp99S00718
MSFLQRVISYVVNELLIDRLANSRAFQRFAVRTSKAAEDLAKQLVRQQAAEQKERVTKQMEEFAKKQLDQRNPPR